jgi:hypothetical protein
LNENIIRKLNRREGFTMEKVIKLLELMAKNNLSAVEEGTKIKHDSYMKGKGDNCLEIIEILKQQGGEKDDNSEV